MSRRRALMAAQETEKGLPDEYQEVTYIASSNRNCLIQTSYYPQLNDSLEFKASTAGASTTTYVIFATGVSTDNCCSLSLYGTAMSCYFNWFSQGGNNRIGGSSGTIPRDKIFLAQYGNGKATISQLDDPTNTFSSTYPTYKGSPANPIALMGSPASTGIGMKGRMYTFTATRGGKTVFKAVPCYRKADTVIGMFDTVSQTFLTNTGTGTLTKGADVT